MKCDINNIMKMKNRFNSIVVATEEETDEG